MSDANAGASARGLRRPARGPRDLGRRRSSAQRTGPHRAGRLRRRLATSRCRALSRRRACASSRRAQSMAASPRSSKTPLLRQKDCGKALGNSSSQMRCLRTFTSMVKPFVLGWVCVCGFPLGMPGLGRVVPHPCFLNSRTCLFASLIVLVLFHAAALPHLYSLVFETNSPRCIHICMSSSCGHILIHAWGCALIAVE